MRILNVIEVVDNTVIGVESFPIIEEQLSEEIVEKAEELFKKKAVENGYDSTEEDDSYLLDDGRWENLDYAIHLYWSFVESY